MAIYFQKFKLPGEDGRGKKHELEHRAGLLLLKEGLHREYHLSHLCMERELSADSGGKPFLTNYPQIYFNISHGRDMAVCGVDNAPLGVDVEAIRPVKPTVFRRVLTKNEQNYLEDCREKGGEGCWHREFFRIWTLKESYAKALGKGLGLDFTCVEFNLIPWEEYEGNGGFSWRKGEMEAFPAKENERLFLLKEVRGSSEEKDGKWRFFQTIVEGEYVISCCLSLKGSCGGGKEAGMIEVLGC